MKKINEKNDRALREVKNIARGALSKLKEKNKPNAKRLHIDMEQASQVQINKAIAIARTKLNGAQLRMFERWLVEQLSEQNQKSSRLGSNINAIGIFPIELRARSVSEELRSAREKISKFLERHIRFVSLAEKIGSHISRGAYKDADVILDEVVKDEGYSYWSIETSLAISFALNGVEEMKAKAKAIALPMAGMSKFFTHYFGVRNEPSQVTSRFKVNMGKRIDDSNLSDELKAYSKFRMYGEMNKEPSFLASILACENITSSIDLVFTLIKVSRFILANKSAFSNKIIAEAEESLRAIRPISSHLGVADHEYFIGSQSASECRLMTLASRAITLSTRPLDAWFEDSSEVEFIIRGIASRLSTRADGLHAEELGKLVLNIGWLPECIEIGDIYEVPSLPELIVRHGAGITAGAYAPLSMLDALIRSVIEIASDLSGNSDDLSVLMVAMDDVNKGEVSISDAQESIRNQSNGVVVDTLRVIYATYFNDHGLDAECLEICSEAGIDNENIITILPLLKMFQGAKWNHIKNNSNSVDLSISLDHFLHLHEERKIRTYKRYAVESLMSAYRCSDVSKLPGVLLESSVEPIKVEYFGANVCDPVTLELIPGVRGSRRVKIVRSGVLRNLAAMHTPREAAYLREADEVDEALLVDTGIQDLDESKIYVDERAVLKSVNKELAADFQRYLKLVESGIGEAEELPELIKHFSTISMKAFQMPKNDADDLLFQIIHSISEAFLEDPASGLDIVIGRRIRHGTISSELRGVLERYELIGQRPRAGADYDPASAIERRFEGIDDKKRKIVFAAFSRFSEAIDQLVALLRDEYFHINSKKKPKGIFDVAINAMFLSLSRSIAQSCQTIDQFSRECIAIFWYVLSLKAEVVGPKIENEVKKTLQIAFSRLIEELKALSVVDAELLANIQHASEELHRRASIIAGWIRVPKVSVEGKAYGLEHAVDVAVAVVVGQKPAFKPIISKAVPAGLMLDLHGFSVVEDALYIAIVNVYEHSGKRVDNNINIEINFDERSSILRFSITNEIASGSRTPEKEGRLDATRNDIQKRAYSERARRDRGSGLCKLAALVMQHDDTEISFGYVGDMFKLDFDLLYLRPSEVSDVGDGLLSVDSVSPAVQV